MFRLRRVEYMKKIFKTKGLISIVLLIVLVISTFILPVSALESNTGNIIVHYYNENNWDIPYIYYYYGSNEGTSWPGEAMISEGNNWYVYEISGYSKANVIFSDSGSSQIPSQNQEGYQLTHEGWYVDGIWYDQKPDGITVHYYNYDSWNNVYIYYYDDDNIGTCWPGVPMYEDGDGWFTYTIYGCDEAQILFNDSQGTQIPSAMEEGFIVSDEIWYRNGEWTTKRPDEVTIYFSKPDDWNEPFIYYYQENSDTALSWPGVKMNELSDNWYSYTITKYSSAKVLFNDRSNQIPACNHPGFDVSGIMCYKDGVWFEYHNGFKNIVFESTANIEHLHDFMGNEDKYIDLSSDSQKIFVNLVMIRPIKNNEAYFEGTTRIFYDNKWQNIDVAGDLYITNEGIIGTLNGLVDEKPMTITLNYAIGNKNPYVFLSVGDAIVENDSYMIYGLREEINDRLSESYDAYRRREYPEQFEDEGVCEEADPNVEVKTKDMESRLRLSNYDTALRTKGFCQFKNGKSTYNLASATLFCPKYVNPNKVYDIYAKTNTHMQNARYYAYIRMGVIGAQNIGSRSTIVLSTTSKNVKFTSPDPVTTGWFTSGVSVGIPIISSKANLAVSLVSFSYSWPSISVTGSKINGSTKTNKYTWQYNAGVSADMSNNSPETTKRGYTASVDMVNYDNSKKSAYTLKMESKVFYSGYAMYGARRTDYSFTCTLPTLTQKIQPK